jgi:hypothetical protein
MSGCEAPSWRKALEADIDVPPALLHPSFIAGSAEHLCVARLLRGM